MPDCSVCGRPFSSEPALNSHYGQVHGAKFDVAEAESLFQSGMSTGKVADEMGVSQRTVVDNINTTRRWQEPQLLEYLYVEKKLNVRELSEELGCSYGTAHTWLQRHGFDTRDRVFEQRRTLLKKPASCQTTKDGYEVARSQTGSHRASVRIHRLVAVAEHGLDSVKEKIVHHKNGIPWDNRPENLELMSRQKHGELHRPVDVRWGNRNPIDAHKLVEDPREEQEAHNT